MGKRRTHGEGAIYQTKDGRWRAAVDLGWKDGARQRKYLSGTTKSVVARKVREALAQAEAGVPLTRDGVGPTVEEWLWYWHDNVQTRRVRETTLSAQEVMIRRHIVPNLGRVRLRELTPEHVESLLMRLEGPSFNSTSVLKVHRCLSRALVVAMQRGLIMRNVCTLIDPPSPQTHEVEPLTRDDA
jgi:integrase